MMAARDMVRSNHDNWWQNQVYFGCVWMCIVIIKSVKFKQSYTILMKDGFTSLSSLLPLVQVFINLCI